MATLFEKLYSGEVFNSVASGKMLRLLGRNYWDEEAIAQIQPFIFTASKNGVFNLSRREKILVMAPSGPNNFSIITKNQKDDRWERDNEGWALVGKRLNSLWNYYETRSDWKPDVNFSGNKKK